MPLFVVTCTDNEGTVEKRLATRPKHLERLQKLNDEGRLIVAGAMPKDPGAIHRQVFMAARLLLTLKTANPRMHGYKMNLS